ncbi:MAG: hypothetical protein ACRC7O_07540 [Fimbriiglobus sp.]
MTRTINTTARFAAAAAADRSTAETILRDVAFVLEMTRRAKSIDTTEMHNRAATKAARRAEAAMA